MNDIIIDGIIIFMGPGDLAEIDTIGTQQKIQNYIKEWPLDTNGNKLHKKLCWWDESVQEVKAKTQAMLDVDLQKEIDREIHKKILQQLGKLLVEAQNKSLTFADFLDTIQQVII